MNKYKHLTAPQAQLDFHDKGHLTEKDIIQITNDFIKTSVQNGFDRVLIITGKGIHSRNGQAIVKPLVQKYLERHANVASVFKGRRDRGGSGALEIKLI